MKRISLILLCLVIVMSAMAGCSVSNTTNQTKTDEAAQPQVETAPVVENPDTGIDASAAHPKVTITMENEGTMVLELYPEIAPNTVNNFISLAQKGYYNGLIFHRVIKGFMIQGGDPTGTGTGGPGYQIKGEFAANEIDNPLKHSKGVISMARSQAFDSAGSQFFIIHGESTFLDGQYAAFGQVVEGLDVIDSIADVATNTQDKPFENVVIKEITVELNGYAFQEPEIIQ